MAIIKHIAVKNRYYSAAVEYLTCKFDEHTMKPLVDDKGRIMMRDSFLIEGINCMVDTFGAECIETNRHYVKNNAAKDVKAHHYIISFSPDDNITMQEAMDFGKQYVEKFLSGHQAILAVHPDGHNGTGNVHVHIVINSVRKLEGKKERWQEKTCEYKQGCKHKSTGKFMRAAKQWVMQECMVRGYNQVNLLARSDANNYWVEKRGKENNPDFKTDKDMIRERLDDLVEKSDDLEHLTYYLENVEYWHIRVTNKTISFQMPHMRKPIRGKSLGEAYDKAALEQRIEKAIEAKEEVERERRLEAERIRQAREEASRREQEKQRQIEAKSRQSEGRTQPDTQLKEQMEAPAQKEPVARIDALSSGEYDVKLPTDAVESVVVQPNMEAISELVDIRGKLICLAYEREYNLNKISDLDYDIRYHNPDYQSYVENQIRITKKQSYINQWSRELVKCNFFQRDLKKIYNEQIKDAEGEIADIKADNHKILSKAGCESEEELRNCQNAYEQKRKLLDTLAQRNQSINRESEALKENYENLISRLDEPTREKFITDKKEYQKNSDVKAEAILKDMYAEAYSGMDAQTVMVRVETELQGITGTVRVADGMVRSRGGR